MVLKALLKSIYSTSNQSLIALSSLPVGGHDISFWIYLGSGSGMLVKSSLVKTDKKKLFKTSAFLLLSLHCLLSGFCLFLTYVQNDFGLLLASFAMIFSKFLLNLLLRFCAAFLFLA